MSNDSPKNRYVLDTVALILWLEKRRMGSDARRIFDLAELGKVNLYIPAMVLSEMMYLSERGRITASLRDVKMQIKKYPVCQVIALDFAVIEIAHQIKDIPELHDRLIAASARLLNVPLLTSDGAITDSKMVDVVW